MFFINLELVDFVFTKNNMVDDHFIQCLDDDLNFPNAITFILQQVKYMSTLFKEKNYDVLVNSLNYIVNELAILGIKYEFNLNNNDKEIISK
jgi:cysteinyl-tRNA synthetase